MQILKIYYYEILFLKFNILSKLCISMDIILIKKRIMAFHSALKIGKNVRTIESGEIGRQNQF